MLKRFFLDHPTSIGETYAEHQRHAFRFAFSLFRGALACFIHGIFLRNFSPPAAIRCAVCTAG